MRLPETLRSLPWATYGRRESPGEFEQKWSEQNGREVFLPYRPRISIYVLAQAAHTAADWEMTLASLRAQSYQNFEVVLVTTDGREPCPLGPDQRFRLLRKMETELFGLRHWTVSNGDFLGLIEPGDVLSPCALYLFVAHMERETDFIFCNEAVLSPNRNKLESFLAKSPWSEWNLMHFNSIGRFWLARRSFLFEEGMWQDALGSSAENFFLLRLGHAKHAHLPAYLYYRARKTSLAPDTGRMSRALVEYGEKTGRKFMVRPWQKSGEHYLKVFPKRWDKLPKVSAVICFRDKAKWTERCLEKLVRAAGSIELEVILVNNQSSQGTLARLKRACAKMGIDPQWLHYDAPFNFARMHNRAVRERATGDVVLILNNDVFLQTENCFEEWASWAMQPNAGTVGIRLDFPNGRVQHAGLRAFFGGDGRVARVGHSQAADRFAYESREVFGNTFAACMVRRELYESLGGLREDLCPNGFGDVWFNFECLKKQLRNFYLGHIGGVHLESASRGLDYEYWEEVEIESRFPEILQRMLRQDLGWNRIPVTAVSLFGLMKLWLHTKVRERMPFVDRWKPALKRSMRNVQGGLASLSRGKVVEP